jgi:type VI secretion system secreted protein VgrG
MKRTEAGGHRAATRIVTARTPLGPDRLMFRSMHGSEGLSRLFEFEVDLLSPSASIDSQAVLGKPLALRIETAGAPRFLHGQVTRFQMIGREDGAARHTVYRATVRPWLWYLTRASNNRIFQDKSVVEILEEVLGAYGFAFEKRLRGSYRSWDFCAQYEETDYAFVCRLMELEGIYFHFRHDESQHTLVLVDDIASHDEIPDYGTIDCFASDRDIRQDLEVIDDWQVTAEVRSGGYTVDDFNFATPRADLRNARVQPLATDQADHDMYEWLGDYGASGDGEHYARVRLEEAQSLAERSTGHATVRGMAPGHRFTMRGSPRDDDNREYLVVSVNYALREGGYASGSNEPGQYGFSFVVQRTDLPFRAPRQTPLPRTAGPQTATVVGPEGEEIWTDRYGRVKLQFRWDRAGRRNEDSSCWVRVSQAWAGDAFGTVHVPRIGEEVIVDFISGRIDRPIVIGRVYNADEMPPFDLPGEATRSGIVSRSTVGGAPANANVLRFEDRTGAEQLLMHAERNLDTEVEAAETHTTGGSRTTLIKGHESSTFERGEERHITRGAVEFIDGSETRTVTGGAHETVLGGETRTIDQGAVETIVGGETRTVHGGSSEDVTGDVVVTVNGAVLRLVTGADIRITCSGRVEIVNALDAKLVIGPDTTVVTGPKTVSAPDINYRSGTFTVNTTNFTLNAKVSAQNTPTQQVNADHQNCVEKLLKAGTFLQLETAGLTRDRYGIKLQFTGRNFLIQRLFINLSGANWLGAGSRKSDRPFGFKKVAVGAAAGGSASSSSGVNGTV